MNKDCSTHLKTFDQNLLEFLTGIANINIENNVNNHNKQKKNICVLFSRGTNLFSSESQLYRWVIFHRNVVMETTLWVGYFFYSKNTSVFF